ncbi:MAG: hypothetical protein V4622_14180 [Bacteroidota bacterium]
MSLGFQSCQSEYSERMLKALELKQKYMEVKDIILESNNTNLKPMLVEIEREIKIQAQISGNEELFLAEVWKN